MTNLRHLQQLFAVPAALGVLATGANAAQLNVTGVSEYSASADQITSVTQFSDVYPTDWAYQALANLAETYGCVAGFPDGTFLGNRAITRFEAASFLNFCLDRITEVTDELSRLLSEFDAELSILEGVDGLEARVGELKQPNSPRLRSSEVQPSLLLALLVLLVMLISVQMITIQASGLPPLITIFSYRLIPVLQVLTCSALVCVLETLQTQYLVPV